MSESRRASPPRRRTRTCESRALSASLAKAEAVGRLERWKASVRRSSRSWAFNDHCWPTRRFVQALARKATPGEQAAAARYLADLKVTHADQPAIIWADFAQSVLNLKEFLYLK